MLHKVFFLGSFPHSSISFCAFFFFFFFLQMFIVYATVTNQILEVGVAGTRTTSLDKPIN